MVRLALLAAVALGVVVRYRAVIGKWTASFRAGDTDSGSPDGRPGDSWSAVVTPPGGQPDPEDDRDGVVASRRDVDAEEDILGLLADHGGRMKQQWIVDARDWSAPLVSQHLAHMEDRGLVVRYAIGRENAVCLPEYALEDER